MVQSLGAIQGLIPLIVVVTPHQVGMAIVNTVDSPIKSPQDSPNSKGNTAEKTSKNGTYSTPKGPNRPTCKQDHQGNHNIHQKGKVWKPIWENKQVNKYFKCMISILDQNVQHLYYSLVWGQCSEAMCSNKLHGGTSCGLLACPQECK